MYGKIEHYEFISKTDKKSLFNQIKFLVDCGKQSFQNDLNTRRDHLRELLNKEEQIYENEFKEKIKSRVERNIRERQNSLMTIKEERKKERERYVVTTKIHQNMLNCLEIRDKLREDNYRDIQVCQLEQMVEKLRKQDREKKDNEFWLQVQKRMEDKYDCDQKLENSLKAAIKENQAQMLNNQVQEHRRELELEKAHAEKLKKELDIQMKTEKSNEKQENYENIKAKAEEKFRDMQTVCMQQKALRDEEQMFEDTFHKETMRQVNKEIQESLRKNLKLRQDMRDYLLYVKKFKNFVADTEKQHMDRVDEMGKIYDCYKNGHKRGFAVKQKEEVKKTHDFLIKQIFEERAKRFMSNAREREVKILENPFARLETRDKAKEQRQIRKDLDAQLEELERLKIAEQKKFEDELHRAAADQRFCEELLAKHKKEPFEYLPPHPNWQLLACYKGCDPCGK